MHDPDDYLAYVQLADQLIERASKEDLADVARILALHIGWYHQRYGDVPQDDLVRLVRSETLQDEGKRLMLHGMQNLVSALTHVMDVTETGEEESRH
jgi:hypothetical protein